MRRILEITLRDVKKDFLFFTISFFQIRNGGDGGIRTLDGATNPILP